MLRSLITFSVLAILLLGSRGAAQVTPIPGTGCGGNATTTVLGAPRPGSRISITNPFPCLFLSALTTVGLPNLVPWTGCINQRCTIAVTPLIGTFGGITNTTFLTIPNDPILVGTCLRAQSGCFSTACVQVDIAVDICIQ